MASMLRLNSTGPAVVRLQRDLVEAGFRLHEDGHFGHATEAVVRLFQKRPALLPDGIAGQVTVRAFLTGKHCPTFSMASGSQPARPGLSPLAAALDYFAGFAAVMAAAAAPRYPDVEWPIVAGGRHGRLGMRRDASYDPGRRGAGEEGQANGVRPICLRH